MKKRIIALMLLACSMFCVSSEAVAQESAPEYQPRYVHIAVLGASLTISNSGFAESTGAISLDPGYTASVLFELQKFDNGWSTIDSVTATGTGPRGCRPYVDMYVAHGTYRAKITATVTDANGNYIETQTANSYVQTY